MNSMRVLSPLSLLVLYNATNTAFAISPIATHFSVAWSVGLSVCRLSHSCSLLKPFDGFTCHLAGTLAGSSNTLGRFGGLNPPQPKIAPAYL